MAFVMRQNGWARRWDGGSGSLSGDFSFRATRMIYAGSSLGFLADPHVGQVGFGAPLLDDKWDAVPG